MILSADSLGAKRYGATSNSAETDVSEILSSSLIFVEEQIIIRSV